MKTNHIVAIAIWTAILATILVVPLFAKSEEEVPMHHLTDEQIAYIDRLSMCESSNNPNAYVHDDGGSPSYGLFQWKAESFYHYNEKYKIVDIQSKKEVINYIKDPRVQTRLTEKVLTEKGGWRNWYNCLKGHENPFVE